MTTAVCHQVTFLPWLGLMQKLSYADVFVLLDDVQFVRRDVQNRVAIKTPAGRAWLTVPVASKGHYHSPIREIELAEHADPDELLRTIHHAYAKAPFFDDIWLPLEATLSVLVRPGASMLTLNETLIRWLIECFSLRLRFEYQSNLDWSGARADMLISCCRAVGADRYVAGKLALEQYMDFDHWRANGIEVVGSLFPPIEYPQLWGPFEYGLSSIDLIANLGVEAARNWLGMVALEQDLVRQLDLAT